MSLEEKTGQLISVGINARFLNQESAEFKELRRQVEQNHVGGIILFRGPVYESVHLVNRMQQLARVPLLDLGRPRSRRGDALRATRSTSPGTWRSARPATPTTRGGRAS